MFYFIFFTFHSPLFDTHNGEIKKKKVIHYALWNRFFRLLSSNFKVLLFDIHIGGIVRRKTIRRLVAPVIFNENQSSLACCILLSGPFILYGYQVEKNIIHYFVTAVLLSTHKRLHILHCHRNENRVPDAWYTSFEII